MWDIPVFMRAINAPICFVTVRKRDSGSTSSVMLGLEELVAWYHLYSRVLPPGSMQELSMGMSSDFETVITVGATLVRVGAALFGGHDQG